MQPVDVLCRVDRRRTRAVRRRGPSPSAAVTATRMPSDHAAIQAIDERQQFVDVRGGGQPFEVSTNAALPPAG